MSPRLAGPKPVRGAFVIMVFQIGQILRWRDDVALEGRPTYLGVLRGIHYQWNHPLELRYNLRVQPLEEGELEFAALPVRADGLVPVSPREVSRARGYLNAFIIHVTI